MNKRSYRGDKYIQAYKHYRDSLDDKVSSNSMRLIQLENAVEFIFARLLEMKEDE
jgi:hypothetical protein